MVIRTPIGLAPPYPYCTATALRIGGRAPIGVIMPESALEQHAESRVRRADGAWIWVEVIGTDRMGEAPLYAAVISIRDITGRKELEEELTGMPNRALLRDRLEHAIARNRRGGGRITLLLVDLDDFKLVNDSLGHNAGDQLITTTALRLHQQLRAADTPWPAAAATSSRSWSRTSTRSRRWTSRSGCWSRSTGRCGWATATSCARPRSAWRRRRLRHRVLVTVVPQAFARPGAAEAISSILGDARNPRDGG